MNDSKFLHDIGRTVSDCDRILSFLEPISEELNRIKSTALQNKSSMIECLDEKEENEKNARGDKITLDEFRCMRDAVKLSEDVPNLSCKDFCCTVCEVMMCSKCIDEGDHDGHSIRSQKQFYKNIVEKFDHKFPSNASEFRREIDQTVSDCDRIMSFLEPISEELNRIKSTALQNKSSMIECLDEKEEKLSASVC